jgi:hypothetical protein
MDVRTRSIVLVALTFAAVLAILPATVIASGGLERQFLDPVPEGASGFERPLPA